MSKYGYLPPDAIWSGKYWAFVSSVSLYQRSMELGADPAWALDNIARAYVALGDREKVAETIDKLRKIDPKAAQEAEQDLRRADK